MNVKRHCILSLLLAVMAFASCSASARMVRNYRTSCTGPLQVLIDSIDYRPDLTRVYGRLSGQPHTSNRIDAATLLVNGKGFGLQDIDGVDVKRWFQYEDDGLIPIEMDFPALQAPGSFVIKIEGPRGESTWTVNQKKN